MVDQVLFSVLVSGVLHSWVVGATAVQVTELLNKG